MWLDFKNSFAWLTGTKKLIFDYNNFFGSGHFLIHQIWKNRLKNSRSQKSCCNQKSVFSCKSTTQRNFWNPFTPVMYSCNFFPVLLMATSIPGVEKFSWKSVCEVFFNELNWNFRVAPESETTGFVLMVNTIYSFPSNSNTLDMLVRSGSDRRSFSPTSNVVPPYFYSRNDAGRCCHRNSTIATYSYK